MLGSSHVVPSVYPGRLVRRIPAEQGDAWALFRTVVGRSEYYLRVPFRGAPQARYITARKWLNGRLAQRFGLPVHPFVPIRVNVRELTLLGAGGDLELNDAGIFLGVAVRRPGGDSAKHVPTLRSALAVLWQNATKPFRVAGELDDSPLFRQRDDEDFPYELRDLSGSQALWQHVLDGREVLRGGAARVSTANTFEPWVVDEAGDRAKGAFLEREWSRITAGVELLQPEVDAAASERLRTLMRGGFERGFAELRAPRR